MCFAEEQSLVFAQRVFDLAIARQRGVVMDAKPVGGLELGLVEVANAALGHQSRGLMGETVPAFARARFGMLTGAMHGCLQPVSAPTLHHAVWMSIAREHEYRPVILEEPLVTAGLSSRGLGPLVRI